MPRSTTTYYLYLVIVFTFLGITWAATGKTSWNKKHKQVKRQAGQLPLLRNQFDISSMLPSQWSMYAPSPPSPEEVECEIELEVIQRVGGRCVRLGGFGQEEGPAVCQSGMHLDIWNDECETIMAERGNGQNNQNAHVQRNGQSPGQGQGGHGSSISEEDGALNR